MAMILTFSGSPRAARFTGIVAGCLVAGYISLEAPLSGMSMNPARSFASAAPGHMWHSIWIYFTAPVAGMLAGAQLFRLARNRVVCAKLVHPPDVRCIHCGYDKHIEVCHRRSLASFPGETPISVVNSLANLAGLCPNCHWEFDHGLLQL